MNVVGDEWVGIQEKYSRISPASNAVHASSTTNISIVDTRPASAASSTSRALVGSTVDARAATTNNREPVCTARRAIGRSTRTTLTPSSRPQVSARAPIVEQVHTTENAPRSDSSWSALVTCFARASVNPNVRASSSNDGSTRWTATNCSAGVECSATSASKVPTWIPAVCRNPSVLTKAALASLSTR